MGDFLEGWECCIIDLGHININMYTCNLSYSENLCTLCKLQLKFKKRERLENSRGNEWS